jgi:pSer/pThr/pTyr-binding forkhead associated (FHA) protein
MGATLTVKAGPGKGTVLDLDRLGSYTIGRSSSSDLQIRDRATSRQHCRIDYDGEFYWLVDGDSHNGTYVNGRKITKCLLYDGDIVTIGHAELAFAGAED